MLLLFWLLAALTLVRAQNTYLRENTNMYHNERSLGVYAMYNIPGFAVEFTTRDTADVSKSMGESSLTFPIQTITQEFLTEEFVQEIESLPEDSSVMYKHLAEVNLQVTLAYSSTKAMESHIALIAEMYGTVAFTEPSDTTSPKPSNTEVFESFGTFLESIFAKKRDLYLRTLVQSDQALLREIVSLEIKTNYNAGSRSGDVISQSSSGMSSMERAMISAMVILGVMGVGWMCLFFAQRRRYQKSMILEEELRQVHDRERIDGGLDSVQHGGDGLEKTDKYLSKHRHDLYEAEVGNSRSVDVFGRNYTIPANPFGYIYSAFQPPNFYGNNNATTGDEGLQPSPRGAFTPRGSVRDLQAGNIAASAERTPFDEIDLSSPTPEKVSLSPGYSHLSNIWRNVSNMWDDSRYRQEHEGLMYQHDEPRSVEWMTFQKEEEDHNLVFQDFPRKDGTPCLIFEDDHISEKANHGIFSIGDIELSPPKNIEEQEERRVFPPPQDAASDEILSDEAFLNLLNVNDASSVEHISSFEDEFSVNSDVKSPEFKHRLSSLFSERYRQYEKRTIVERHQQKRKMERERERRERQKDMHRELEAIESSMPVADKWRSKHHVSPRPYDKSPSRATYSSDLQIRQRSPRAGRLSPIPRHVRNRSLESFSMSKSPARAGLEGLPGMDHDSVKLIRPRASSRGTPRTPPIHAFHDGRSRDTNFDHSALEKLSMPNSISSAESTFVPKLNPKYPLPTSVMDDVNPNMMPPRNPPPIKQSHGRVNIKSSDYKRGDLETIGANIPTRSPRPRQRGMAPARRGLSPKRSNSAYSPSRGRRPVPGLSPSARQRTSSNSSRHSRTGSVDGVFDHGIAALI
jgi:hypothetical protein